LRITERGDGVECGVNLVDGGDALAYADPRWRRVGKGVFFLWQVLIRVDVLFGSHVFSLFDDGDTSHCLDGQSSVYGCAEFPMGMCKREETSMREVAMREQDEVDGGGNSLESIAICVPMLIRVFK